MAAATEFRLPDLGEGLLDAEIVRWAVHAGDRVALNDVLVEVETAKAVVELPSPRAGIVAELRAAEGDTVAVGTPIVVFADDAARAPAGGSAPQGDGASAGADAAPAPEAAAADQTAAASDSDPAGEVPGPSGGPAASSAPAEEPAAPATLVGYGAAATDPRSGRRVAAAPAVRRLARGLGVDLAAVSGTGPDGHVTRADVERAASAPSASSVSQAATFLR